MEDDEWVEIPGFEGFYEITRSGRIRSLSRLVNAIGTSMRRLASAEMSPSPIKRQRYLRVTLSKGGIRYHDYIHSLVARTFLGPRPKGMLVCHNNGVFQDNRVENLRYDTHAGNSEDAIRHGVVARGKKIGGYLDDEQVKKVRALLTENTITETAKLMRVPRGIVTGIAYNRNYRHVPDESRRLPNGTLSYAMFF